MFGSGIKICKDPATVLVRRTAWGGVRVTYSRGWRLLAAAVLLAAGGVVWVLQLPPDPWREPIEYALAALLMAPGLYALTKALRPRAVIDVGHGDLVVRYGPPFLERALARLPLDGLEAEVRTDLISAVRYDAHAVSKRLLASLAPLLSARLPESEVKLHVLQVRNKGQDVWLPVLGSQVASEVENARLAILAAAAELPDDLVEEEEDEEGTSD